MHTGFTAAFHAVALTALLVWNGAVTAGEPPAAVSPAADSVAASDAPATAALRTKPTSPAAVGGTGGELRSATLRMTVGLGIVLALLGGIAWLSRRFRVTGGMRGGAIEVLSGISLGTREKVVLLRVGREQVLVGVSAAGMRTLHVLDPRNASEFSTIMQDRQ